MNIGINKTIKLQDKHNHNTRLAATSNYFMPQPRTNLGLMSFSYLGPKLWQGVPTKLKKLIPNLFKRQYKLFLSERYTQN